MAARIYFDLDECLISTHLYASNLDKLEIDFSFRLEGARYHTIINPASLMLLEMARDLVGFSNVWILTASQKDYAREINKYSEFKFPEEQILSRDDIKSIVFQHENNPDYKNSHKKRGNVLIDNLPIELNEEKIIVGGISYKNYHQVPEFYGEYPEGFKEGVIEFLHRRFKK
jgi:hypothetical protein